MVSGVEALPLDDISFSFFETFLWVVSSLVARFFEVALVGGEGFLDVTGLVLAVLACVRLEADFFVVDLVTEVSCLAVTVLGFWVEPFFWLALLFVAVFFFLGGHEAIYWAFGIPDVQVSVIVLKVLGFCFVLPVGIAMNPSHQETFHSSWL